MAGPTNTATRARSRHGSCNWLANQSTPSEDFTVEVRPSDDAAVVVGSASRELAAGETEVYDLTLTVPNAGELALTGAELKRGF